MIINTRIFGEIEVDESRIITFASGIVGFPLLKEFSLIHDENKGDNASIHWLQSIQEPAFALPVMDPLLVYNNYNPLVEEEHLHSLGKFEPEDLLVLVTLTVPTDIEEMSVNLRAPIIVNSKGMKACQVVAEGEDYPVKYKIYELLQARKAEKTGKDTGK